MFTGNPIRIQKAGTKYKGARPAEPFLPSQLAKIGQRHGRADELEGFLGLPTGLQQATRASAGWTTAL